MKKHVFNRCMLTLLVLISSKVIAGDKIRLDMLMSNIDLKSWQIIQLDSNLKYECSIKSLAFDINKLIIRGGSNYQQILPGKTMFTVNYKNNIEINLAGLFDSSSMGPNEVLAVVCIPKTDSEYPEVYIPEHASKEAKHIMKNVLNAPMSGDDNKNQEEFVGIRDYLATFFKERSENSLKKHSETYEIEVIDGVEVFKITPKNLKDRKKAIIYIHGGAYTLFQPEQLTQLYLPIADEIGVVVYAIKYSLSPEVQFPIALQECSKVFKALVAKYGKKNIMMLGNSAGGALAISTLLENPENSDIAALGLYSPWADIKNKWTPVKAPDFSDQETVYDSARAYLGKNGDPTHPLISPVYADYSKYKFPPVQIHSGSLDFLSNGCARLQQVMEDGGINTNMQMWELWHDFQLYDELPESKQSVSRMARFGSRHLNIQYNLH